MSLAASSDPLPANERAHMTRSQPRALPLLLCGWFTCMWFTVSASLGLAVSAHAERLPRWRPHPNVGVLEQVTLRIHWLESTSELWEAAKKNGQFKQIGLNGFSILKRDTTGAYVCDVYIVRLTNELVDGERTTTFGHEVLHCFGLQHE